MGLYMTSRILLLHKGMVYIENLTDELGVRITIALPLLGSN
jgi:hypothetical protein